MVPELSRRSLCYNIDCLSILPIAVFYPNYNIVRISCYRCNDFWQLLRRVVKHGLNTGTQGEAIGKSCDESGEVKERRDTVKDSKFLAESAHLLRLGAGGIPLLAITLAYSDVRF